MPTAANPLARDLDEVLASMGVLWEDLRGARLFITGGTGFFGCWLLETLLWANDRLGLNASAVVLTRTPNAFRQKVPHLATHPIVTLHQGDVRSFEFPEGSFSHVIHAAVDATPAASRDDRLRAFDTTVLGTRRVLDFANQSGVRRFLLTSSGAVYGQQPPDTEFITEDFVGAPNVSDANLSGAEAKRAAEALCSLYRDARLATTTARCFAFIGPYLPLDDKFAAGNFIRNALRREPIRILGDGTPYRSYMYGSDLSVWLWTILLKGRGYPYNVGSETAVSIRDLAELVSAQSGSGSPVVTMEISVPGQPAHRYVPSTERARRELRLGLTLSLEEAISRTMAWHQIRATSRYAEN